MLSGSAPKIIWGFTSLRQPYLFGNRAFIAKLESTEEWYTTTILVICNAWNKCVKASAIEEKLAKAVSVIRFLEGFLAEELFLEVIKNCS